MIETRDLSVGDRIRVTRTMRSGEVCTREGIVTCVLPKGFGLKEPHRNEVYFASTDEVAKDGIVQILERS